MNLSEMAALQHVFDVTRGFASLPFGPADDQGDASDIPLRRLEYATMGLVGEAGELANIVKKVRRSLAVGGRSAAPEAIPNEVADVTSYLLKLCTTLQLDLETTYLRRLLSNYLRFARVGGNPRTVVSCAGPPNVGKTTIAERLRAHLGSASVYVERYEGNPYLPGLLGNGAFNAKENQLWFIDRYTEFFGAAENTSGPIALDQDPSAPALVYARYFAEEGALSPTSYASVLQRGIEVESALERTGRRRRIFLLDAPVDVLVARGRGKDGGREHSEEFLERIRRSFHETYAPVSTVNCIDTTRRSPDDVVREVLETIGSDGAAPTQTV